MASLSPCQVRACRPSLVDVSKQTLIVPDKRFASDLKSVGGDNSLFFLLLVFMLTYAKHFLVKPKGSAAKLKWNWCKKSSPLPFTLD